MKIAICSDLHLEFGDIILKNEESADVLILGGDILVAADFGKPDRYNILEPGAKDSRYMDFMSRCSFQFPHVILIVGNHEHYHGDFQKTIPILRARFKDLANVHILDQSQVVIDNVTFIGGTLWTDMNKEDPLTMLHIKGMMNDFRTVYNGTMQRRVPLYKVDEDGKYVVNEKTGFYIEDGFKFKDEPAKFTPADAVKYHKDMIEYIRLVIEGKFDQKFVVVGHHTPSRLSTHEMYKGETLMNGGYSSSLDEFILDHPQIKLWTHGHTHHEFDYMIGSTRIVCNPRGYINYEAQADNFKLKYVEV